MASFKCGSLKCDMSPRTWRVLKTTLRQQADAGRLSDLSVQALAELLKIEENGGFTLKPKRGIAYAMLFQEGADVIMTQELALTCSELAQFFRWVSKGRKKVIATWGPPINR